MALPPNVAPNELIESSWGNAVVGELGRLQTQRDADVNYLNAANATQDGRLNALEAFVPTLGYASHAWAAGYQNGIQNAYVAVQGMRADWIARNGHVYLITCHVEFYKAGSDISADVELVCSLGSSGTNVGRARGFCEQGYSVTLNTSALIVSGPDHPDFVQAYAQTPSGFVNAQNDRLLVVQDLGTQ